MKRYWKWLFVGYDQRRPGILKFADRWLALHIFVAVLLAWIVPVALADAAKTILLPLAGVLVGLSFAWGGNAQAVLASEEFDEISAHHPGGIEEYAFTFQSAILCLLMTLALWGLAGLEVFDKVWPTDKACIPLFAVEATLYFFGSLSLRECWQVVMSAHYLLIMRKKVMNSRSKPKPDSCGKTSSDGDNPQGA